MIKVFCLWILSAQAFAADVTLILNWKPEAEFGGFYAADQIGAYAKENLKVKILPGGAGTPTAQMVFAGKAEFGVSSADAVAVAQDRGSDVVALFAVYQTNPQGLLVREERGAKTMKDLFQSGVLAVEQGLPYFLFLKKKYGAPKAKLVPHLGGVSQLEGNVNVAQQCFATSEPILLEEKGMKGKTFLASDEGFNPYTTLVTVKRTWAEKNKATVEAFVRATRAGWEHYLKKPLEANGLMNKLNPTMDLKSLARSAEIQKGFIENDYTRKHGVGAMDPARWETLAAQMKDLGLIKKPLPAASYVWSAK